MQKHGIALFRDLSNAAKGYIYVITDSIDIYDEPLGSFALDNAFKRCDQVSGVLLVLNRIPDDRG